MSLGGETERERERGFVVSRMKGGEYRGERAKAAGEDSESIERTSIKERISERFIRKKSRGQI